MKTIQLTQGKVALVSDRDYKWLSQWDWYAWWSGRNWYAVRTNTDRSRVYMHRAILGLVGKVLADHKDGNGLNNQRRNLRPATYTQNGANRHKLNNPSGYRRVFKNGQVGWMARIKNSGVISYLGTFRTPELAAKAYDKAAKKVHGKYASLNF